MDFLACQVMSAVVQKVTVESAQLVLDETSTEFGQDKRCLGMWEECSRLKADCKSFELIISITSFMFLVNPFLANREKW